MEASDTSASSNGTSTESPWAAHDAAESTSAHPEIPVLGAFVGGFVLAKVLKALGGGDD